MAQQQSSNTTAAAVRKSRDARRSIEPPEGLAELSPRERLLWDQITHRRAIDSWAEIELIGIHRACLYLAEIEVLNKLVISEGYLVPGANDNMVAHPALKIAEAKEKMVLSIFRLHGISMTSREASTRNTSGVTAVERENFAADPPVGVTSIKSGKRTKKQKFDRKSLLA